MQDIKLKWRTQFPLFHCPASNTEVELRLTRFLQNNIFWKFVCVWLYFCCNPQLVLQMFSCWHRTDIIFFYNSQRRISACKQCHHVCCELPWLLEWLISSPEKNSLRSDALYAFFNKSLVFRSVISNWYLIRSLLFTLHGF